MPNRCSETVAAPRHGLDQTLLAVAQRLTHVAHATRQRRVRHDDVRPYCFDQFVLRHQPAGILDEVAQHLEALRPEVDLAVAAAKYPVSEVERTVLEAKDILADRLHEVSLQGKGPRTPAVHNFSA